MSKNLKISLLMKVLLVSICIVACNCGGAPEEKKKEEKKKEALVKKEKESLGSLKKDLNLPQAEWEKVEKALQGVKNNTSIEDLDGIIATIEKDLAKKHDGYNAPKSDKNKEKDDEEQPYDEDPRPREMPREEIPAYMKKECMQHFFDVLDPIMIKKDDDEKKKIGVNFLEIFKNFKEQAELKNKGGNKGGSSPAPKSEKK